VAEGLTPAQVKASRLADNRTHEEAEWDHDLLGLELADLREPRRVFRRLLILRGWSHDKANPALFA
jgi:hypothetical protein